MGMVVTKMLLRKCINKISKVEFLIGIFNTGSELKLLI